MFDSPFHYNYTRLNELKIGKPAEFNTTAVIETRRSVKTTDSLVLKQKKLRGRRFLLQNSKISSTLKGGATSYFVNAIGSHSSLDLEMSNASCLVEINCKGKSRFDLKQRFSGISSLVVNVEKNSELEINIFSKSEGDSVLNIVGVNAGVLTIFISNLALKKHSDVILNIENTGSAAVTLKSVVFESLGLKGMDFLKGSGRGRTTVKTLLVGEDSTASILPSAVIQDERQFFSHSASVERISESQVFYLQTRSFKKQEAEKVIWQGFLKKSGDYE